MPTDLPRPREREDLPIMCRYCSRDVTETHRLLAASVPPVSEASPEGMPELAEPWAIIDGCGYFETNPVEDRSTLRKLATGESLVRLAVVEVAREPEPEPETAPSGWRYERRHAELGRPTGSTSPGCWSPAMRRLRERDQVAGVVGAWVRQYGRREKLGILRRLEALDLNIATAEDVAAIIGNHSWVMPQECHECGRETWDLVQIGEEVGYDRSVVNVCLDCLKAALALLEARRDQ